MAKEIQLKKVAICVPNEAYIQPESYDNHLVHAMRTGAWVAKMRYEKRDPSYEIHWYTTGRLLTQAAREKFLRLAVTEGMDYVIMYDSDMVLPPDFSRQMVTVMEEHPEIDVLGALAFMRTPPHYPVIYNLIEGYDQKRHSEYFINQNVKRYPKDTLVECDAVGFGGVIINMEFVRKKLIDPYFMSTTPTGEDLWFCFKVKEAGGRVFMDTRIKLGHIKNPEIIDEEGFEEWVKKTNHDLGPVVPNKYTQYDK